MEMETSDTPEQNPDRGSSWLRERYDYFAPVREEALKKGYADEEINTAIDETVRAVRSARATKAYRRGGS